jgi:hypothetical protein
MSTHEKLLRALAQKWVEAFDDSMVALGQDKMVFVSKGDEVACGEVLDDLIRHGEFLHGRLGETLDREKIGLGVRVLGMVRGSLWESGAKLGNLTRQIRIDVARRARKEEDPHDHGC